MDYQKPYQVEVTGNEIFLINGTTGEKEYKVDFNDLSEAYWPAVAINRDDKIRIPICRINNESMGWLKQHYPECFI